MKMMMKSTNSTTITPPSDIPILTADAVAADGREDGDNNDNDNNEEISGEVNDDGGGGGGGDAVVKKQIVKSVLRQKLQKLRHLVLPNVINPKYLDALFPQLLENFDPQIVKYNGGVANIQQWKISCYLEVMDGGVPTADPNVQLLELFNPLLNKCNDLFMEWYKQQHSCNSNIKGKGGSSSFWERRARQKQHLQQQQQKQKQKHPSPGTDVDGDADTATEGKENVNAPSSSTSKCSRISTTSKTLSKSRSVTSDQSNKTSLEASSSSSSSMTCRRLMTFITRYTAAPGEQSLLKHVDGAGKVDGSVVVALPIDRWSAPHDVNSFEGHGGGLTFWDGKERILPTTTTTTTTASAATVPPSDDGNGQGNTAATATTTSTRPREIHYDTRSGDIAFIDKAVWHQADPITKGTRWALVIFYKVE